jgi:hypothetical protein
MKKMPPVPTPTTSRRKVLAGIGILSLFSIWIGGLFPKKGSAIACAPPEKKETMKVLSQDGQLVEVDISRIKLLQEKISDKELQEWVKKK